MGLIAKQPEGNFELPPPGSHLAICYGLIDIGLQVSTYNGEEKIKEKVVLRFELCNELMEDGRPFIVSAFRTNSLAPRAVLRSDLESWRGRAFTEEELKGFSLEAILGKPCMLSLVAATRNGKDYVDIDNVSMAVKGMDVPAQHNPTVVYDMDKPDPGVFEALAPWLQDKIRGAIAPEPVGGHQRLTPPEFDDLEDIPFSWAILFVLAPTIGVLGYAAEAML